MTNAPHSVSDGRPRNRRTALALWSPEMASPGGVQSYMWRLWEMLAELGKEFGVDPKGLSLKDAPEALQAWNNATNAHPQGASDNKFSFVTRALGAEGSAQCVVVGHVHQAPVAWLARLLGRIDHYIVVLHGIEAWRRLSWLQRVALKHAGAVVATTQYTARVCAEANQLQLKNFRIVALCAEPAPAPPAPGFFLDGGFRILFVGRLAETEKYKGLETLMQAVHSLDPAMHAKLHVVGDGNDRARLKALAADLGLNEGSIHFHGRVGEAELQAAYASAHVFSMPSAKEGFGIVFLEAMRHRLPCLGGAHGGTPEVLTDGVEGVLVPYGDVDALRSSLQLLATDEALRARLAAAAKRRFDAEYTFPAFAARWREVLLPYACLK